VAFVNLKGQEAAISFLVNSLVKNRLAPAYLFLGPGGVGKGLAAKNFAKALNCENASPLPCDSCQVCKKIDRLIHPDVTWIGPDKSGAIKIEQIRQLQRIISLRPYEARKKISIIQDAQNLTEEACASLLKTLEEPPGDCLLILTCTNRESLPFTILSRCQMVLFKPLAREVVEEILTNNFNLNQKQARILARLSLGSLERALEFNQLGQGRDTLDLLKKVFMPEDFPQRQLPQELLGYLELSLIWLREILVQRAGLGSQEPLAEWGCQSFSLKEELSFENLEKAIWLLIQSHRLIQENVNAQFVLRSLKDNLARLGLVS
jgi:DNA polymerase-3 subunit delta'